METRTGYEHRVRATRIYEMGVLAMNLHEAEVVVHDAKLLKKDIVGRLKSAQAEDIGDAIVPIHGEYMMCQDSLHRARLERSKARTKLESHKKIHGIRKVWYPELVSANKIRWRYYWA